MQANNFCTSTCFAIFELIIFTCFGLTLSYPHKEFLNPRPPRSKYNPHPPRSKFNPHAKQFAGTRNPRGLTRPAQDSNTYHSYTNTYFSIWTEIITIMKFS